MGTTIPTHSTGDYLSSSDWDTLTQLNTAVGLFGTSTAIAGTPGATVAPSWYIQTGVLVATATAANFTCTFANAFPNGLLCCFMGSVGGGGNQDLVVTLSTSNGTRAVGQLFRGGSAYTGSFNVQYLAIGW